MKPLVFAIFCWFSLCLQTVWSQKTPKKIVIEHSDFADVNENELPGAFLLTGNVSVNHDGAVLTCNKAYYFKNENYIKAFGNVQIVQGDTLYLNSKYAEYNGNLKKAFALQTEIAERNDAVTLTHIGVIYYETGNNLRAISL